MAKKRKTRQEKKIAELRRKLTAQRKTTKKSPYPENIHQDLPEKTKSAPQKPRLEKTSSLQTFDKKTVKGDLFKTLILSALAISLELVIYFISRQS